MNRRSILAGQTWPNFVAGLQPRLGVKVMILNRTVRRVFVANSRRKTSKNTAPLVLVRTCQPIVNSSSSWKVGEKRNIAAPVENGGLSMFIPLFIGFQPSVRWFIGFRNHPAYQSTKFDPQLSYWNPNLFLRGTSVPYYHPRQTILVLKPKNCLGDLPF